MDKFEYGKMIQEARLRKGQSQFVLSRLVGCTESFVSRIETGRSTPDQRLKDALAKELDLVLCEV